MAKPKKKKVVVTTQREPAKKRVQPTVSRRSTRSSTTRVDTKQPVIFGKQNFILMGVGAALIALGMLLMGGGAMPDPNTWDPDIIYSFRRTVIAPFTILAGLIIEIYAIFK